MHASYLLVVVGIASAPAISSGDGVRKSVDERAADLAAGLRHLLADDVDTKRLEALCGEWTSPRVLEKIHGLDVEYQLCKAHLAVSNDNDYRRDHALDKAREALAQLPSSSPKRAELETRLQYWEADLFAQGIRAGLSGADDENAKYDCAGLLGLPGLRKQADRDLGLRVRTAIGGLERVVVRDVEPWSTRALLQIAELSIAARLRILQRAPRTYRGVSLPSPLLVDEINTQDIFTRLVDDKLGWKDALTRLIDRVASRIDDENPRKKDILRRLNAGLVDQQDAERAKQAFSAPNGAIRFVDGKLERNSGDGWTTATESELRKAVADAEHDLRWAYAVVAAAASGTAVVDEVEELLSSEKPTMVFMGALAAQGAPDKALFSPLIDALNTHLRRDDRDSYYLRFATLQSALFGVEERLLLALRALLHHDRRLVWRLFTKERIPKDERMWIVANLDDRRIHGKLSETVETGTDRAGAIALYGYAESAGRRAMWLLAQQKWGLRKCVGDLMASRVRKRSSNDEESGAAH